MFKVNKELKTSKNGDGRTRGKALNDWKRQKSTIVFSCPGSSIPTPCKDNRQEPVDNRQEPVDNRQEPVDNRQEPVDNRQEPLPL